jgi:hypothetical protein
MVPTTKEIKCMNKNILTLYMHMKKTVPSRKCELCSPVSVLVEHKVHQAE